MNSQEMFKEHYNNYKPTLDQIKNFDILSLKSSSEAANLAELKHNAAKRFAKADFHNFYKKPSRNKRDSSPRSHDRESSTIAPILFLNSQEILIKSVF